MEDEERPVQPKKFEDEELEALLDKDCCQTQEELAESLGVTQAAISKRLKAARYIKKQGNWVPHELKPRDVEWRFCMSEMLMRRHKKMSFVHWIVTDDEKLIHSAKVMLCIWRDQKGVLHYSLLKPGKTINGERYRTHLIRLKREIAEKRTEYATGYEEIISHHDNARPHVAIPVKNYLENSGWEVLPHLPHSPDLAPSDYHLFQSMQNALTGIRFTSELGIKNWLHSFLAAKPAQFFWNGIHKLPERWEKVIASDGQYFE